MWVRLPCPSLGTVVKNFISRGEQNQRMRCQANSICGIDCSDTPHNGCGCIYRHPRNRDDTGSCECECYLSGVAKVKIKKRDTVKTVPIQKLKYNFKATASTKIDVCLNNLPAGALAELLDKILPNRILVPASQANARITMRSKYTTISKVVKSSGFILRR